MRKLERDRLRVAAHQRGYCAGRVRRKKREVIGDLIERDPVCVLCLTDL